MELILTVPVECTWKVMFRKSLYARDLRHESVPQKTTLVNCCRSKKKLPYMEILWACIEGQGLTLHSVPTACRIESCTKSWVLHQKNSIQNILLVYSLSLIVETNSFTCSFSFFLILSRLLCPPHPDELHMPPKIQVTLSDSYVYTFLLFIFIF